MKTRLLFATMVLPTLFAACTNDEIMENQSPSLDGRALLNPNFSISVVDGADTRFSWNEKEFGWNAFTAEDKFSAGLVDNDGTVQDKVLTNYIFSTADGNNYTTTSQMVEGVYMFYSYPGFESNAKREPLAFDLTKQVSTDLKNPTKVIDDNQLFIAPLYNLEAETANEQLGLTFYSYWSAAAIAIKNASKQSFKIVRILLTDETDEFAVKGTISPQKMNAAKLVYSYNEETGKYELPDKAGDILTADIALAGATENPSLVLDCGSYELTAGASTVAYMQVPAGFYTKGEMKVEVVVEVAEEEGTALKSLEKEVVTNFTNNDNVDQIRFRRGKTTAAFGVKEGKPVAFEVDDIELLSAPSASGLYASSYEDVYNYLTDKELGNNLDIYNIGSLSVDDKMMTLMSRLTTKTVKFVNSIEITSESRTGATLRGMEFSEGATITKGNITFGSGVKIAAEKTLTINEGAAATLGADADETAFAGNVKNNGTLKLNGSKAVKVENGEKAIVEVIGDQTLGLNGIATFNTPATLKVNEGKTLTLASGLSLTIDYGKILENSGEITGDGTLTNNGVIENKAKGTIAAVTNTNLTPVNNVKRVAVINNYGELTTVTNSEDETNGKSIVVMKSADAKIGEVSYGEVDNTVGGFITTNNATNPAVVFAEYSGNQSGELGKVMACNKVILKNGAWARPVISVNVKTLDLSGVTLTMGTEEGDGEKLGSAVNLSMRNCVVEGNLEMANAETVDFTGSTFNGNLTLGTSATALPLRGVTFNGNVTATSATTVTILETTNVENTTTTVGGVADFGSAAVTVNQKATLAVGAGAEVKAASITNNGAVRNQGTLTLTGNITDNGEWAGPTN